MAKTQLKIIEKIAEDQQAELERICYFVEALLDVFSVIEAEELKEPDSLKCVARHGRELMSRALDILAF